MPRDYILTRYSIYGSLTALHVHFAGGSIVPQIYMLTRYSIYGSIAAYMLISSIFLEKSKEYDQEMP